MAKSSKKKLQPAAKAAAMVQGARGGEGKRADMAHVGKKAKSERALKAKLLPEGPAKRATQKIKQQGLLPASNALSERDRLTRLLQAIEDVRAGVMKSDRTQKLLKSGVPKMAQKVVEEAAEAAIDAVRGERLGLINESADLLFNLVVLWSALDVMPTDVWAEMDRRETMFGLAEKLPKITDGVDL